MELVVHDEFYHSEASTDGDREDICRCRMFKVAEGDS
jgi:hypothetical protein